MLTLIQGNRLEALADRLLADWDEGDPFDLRPQAIVVPSLGIARWLKYAIADRTGVCCNVEFPFPAQFVWRTFASVLPEIPAGSPFEASVMAWRVFDLFASLPAREEFAPLARYLARADGRGRMDLAQRIARLFDRYLALRPDWLQAWAAGRTLGLERSETERWQAALWRMLLASMDRRVTEHPRHAVFAALDRLAGTGSLSSGLIPERIRVFGVPLLPPLYVEVFARLARFAEVEMYLLNPCREYWADIVSERELARLALRDANQAALRDVGHPLLASFGRQARDNLALLAALGGEEGVEDHEAFVSPAGETLLARLQRSILDLEDLPGTGLAIADDDRSLEVHACHSLTRQLEVLHDQLLARFAADATLRPADVVVMLPDLDAAAPLIDAVFGAAPEARRMPWAITGLAQPEGTPLTAALARLLGLGESRFEAAALIDLMATPAIAARFDLSDPDLAQFRAWLTAAGVRWGRDAGHRAALGLPSEGRHSWAEGLAALLLGHALPARGTQVFGGLLPQDAVEGLGALALGKLARVLAELARLAESLTAPRPPAQWERFLARLLGRFFDPSEAEQGEIRRIQQAIAKVAGDAAAAASERPVGVALMAAELARELSASAPGAVPTGAVTFCGIGLLRGIPYRLVCLLGLDDGAFPRNPSPEEFDLMVAQPRLGDRARREDDRGAFLDALLAARDGLYLSYTGRSIRDNAALPPSLVLGELIDYLTRCVACTRDEMAARITTEHPLQPFSPRYFRGEGLFSYASEYLPAATTSASGVASRATARPLLAGALPEPGEEWLRIDLDRLTRFVSHPVKFLLRERLRIDLAEADQELESAEPFLVARTAGWRLDERLLAASLDGADEDRLRRIALAGTELPHGVVGAVQLESMLVEVRAFAEAVRILRPAEPLAPVPFEVEAAGVTLTGTLSGLSADGLFAWRLASESAFTLIQAWLRHLALNVARPAGAGLASRWLIRDTQLVFRPVEAPREILDSLAKLYRRGLVEPLPFAPRSALSWLDAKGVNHPVQRRWRGNQSRAGENDDPWFRALFGEVRRDLPDGFEALADEILGPLSRHLERLVQPVAAGQAAAPA